MYKMGLNTSHISAWRNTLWILEELLTVCCEHSSCNKALPYCSLKVDIKGSLLSNDISLGFQCFLPSRFSRRKKQIKCEKLKRSLWHSWEDHTTLGKWLNILAVKKVCARIKYILFKNVYGAYISSGNL